MRTSNRGWMVVTTMTTRDSSLETWEARCVESCDIVVDCVRVVTNPASREEGGFGWDRMAAVARTCSVLSEKIYGRSKPRHLPRHRSYCRCPVIPTPPPPSTVCATVDRHPVLGLEQYTRFETTMLPSGYDLPKSSTSNGGKLENRSFTNCSIIEMK